MTRGQAAAVAQLEKIATTTDAVSITEVRGPTDDSALLRVSLSLYCGDMPTRDDGLKLRDRERFTVNIDPEFPYDYPQVWVPHRRFEGFPHVQWGRYLCLYVAPQTEWNPADGIFGFMTRLEAWLRCAALNQLDPTGGPIHPPVAYTSFDAPMVIVRADAPVQCGERWFGVAELKQIHERRLDLVGWRDLDAAPDGVVGAAILLDADMPFEYPTTVGKLLTALCDRGVPMRKLLRPIGKAIALNGEDQPLYVVLGAPMRGVRGGQLRQHLTVWRIEPDSVKLLNLQRTTINLVDKAAGLVLDATEVSETVAEHFKNAVELHSSVVELVVGWAEKAKTKWCRVRECREEVTVRRDESCPLEAIRGRTVEVWGCGALGSHIAEALVRGGVKRLILRDSGEVAPGVLLRQRFDDDDIGRCKAAATAQHLQRLRLDCDIEASGTSVLRDPLGDAVFTAGSDLIVDTTASRVVQYRLEEVWGQVEGDQKPAVCTLMVDATASYGMLALSHGEHTGCSWDVLREAKTELCRRENLREFREAFYPSAAVEPFQPEPGCSDATFVGSEADVSALSALMLNVLCEEFRDESGSTAVACLIRTGKERRVSPRKVRLEFKPSMRFPDPGSGFEVRVHESVWKEVTGWARECSRTRGKDVETGGLLFGECDDYLRVIWVSEASGPPPDSEHSARLFVCGTAGTRTMAEFKKRRSKGSVHYVGTWHTHPVSDAIPSVIDWRAMDRLLGESGERLVLLIIGRTLSHPQVNASVFRKEEFERLRSEGRFDRHIAITDVTARSAESKQRVGLALSGGGSRAMAYHLGCLRALNDRDVLRQVDVVSTVSGGSVIGAMYAFSDDSFEDFDRRVCAALRKGMVWMIARETFFSSLTLKIAATVVGSTLPAVGAFAVRKIVGVIEGYLQRAEKTSGAWSRRIQPPFRRWASRTDAFAQGLRRELFGDKMMTDRRRGDVNIVINACELRTGSAFRFGNQESGTWRLGTLQENKVAVALAVAASAAYPLLLPALDRQMDFESRNGEKRRERIILTDGGVYENLGILTMAPSRSSAFSTNVFQPEYIICCDAGRGDLDDTVLPFGLGSRAARSFEAVHRQVQHGVQAQLHLWQSSGAIRGFVYSYLGQQDHRLPYAPADLISRSAVEHYPTDFSPMSEADRERLAARGYQLTRLLLDHYCAEL